jgi:hypothetical protein
MRLMTLILLDHEQSVIAGEQFVEFHILPRPEAVAILQQQPARPFDEPAFTPLCA